ncbi:MAG TPA: GGDEF domain-containing protein, partial [Pirellulaceae bacterium]|nr:GGDEF domain-containing protein [Pirellulaceae bacterium]
VSRTSFRVCLVGRADERRQAWRQWLERHGVSVLCQPSMPPTRASVAHPYQSVVDDSDAELPLVVVRSTSDSDLEPAPAPDLDPGDKLGDVPSGPEQLERASRERPEYGLIVVRPNCGEGERGTCESGGDDRAGACEPDATLAEDATERELVQVCDLVARIARLRRQTLAARIAASRFQRLAELDPLTGIANRRAWEAALERTASECADRRTGLTVALFDLDEFKQINDRRGMVVGDRVLIEVAEALSKASESSGAQSAFVARLGGDEFIVMWEVSSRDDSRARIDQLRTAVARSGESSKSNLDAARSASVGWTNWRPRSESSARGEAETPLAVQVLTIVDRALREAKLAGRGECRESFP